MNDIELQELKFRIEKKERLWLYSFIFSFLCILFTYMSQFFFSNMASTDFPATANDIMYWLFIAGFQIVFNFQKQQDPTAAEFMRQIYFYLIIFWLNVIELNCFNYLKDKYINKKEIKLDEMPEYDIEQVSGKSLS